MRVSAKCDYACRAVLELTLHWPRKEPVQIHVISKKQDIPMKYLVQILIQLKRMGLVESLRGKEGGYNLSRPPHKIRLGELMRQICGPFLPLSDSVKKKRSVFEKIWSEAEDAMAGVLDEVTFADIAKKAKRMDKTITYQI